MEVKKLEADLTYYYLLVLIREAEEQNSILHIAPEDLLILPTADIFHPWSFHRWMFGMEVYIDWKLHKGEYQFIKRT